MPQEPESPEPARVGDLQDVGREPVDGIGVAIGGLVAGSVPAMVEDDDGVIERQRGDVIGEILLGSAEAVHEHQARARARRLDRQSDTVVRRDPHLPMLTHGR